MSVFLAAKSSRGYTIRLHGCCTYTRRVCVTVEEHWSWEFHCSLLKAVNSTVGLLRRCSGKESVCHEGDVGDVGLIHGLGRSPGGGSGNSLQYSCLEKYHRQRSLVGHGPWGSQRVQLSWTTEHTHTGKQVCMFSRRQESYNLRVPAA